VFKGGLETIDREFGCKSRRGGWRSDRKNHNKLSKSGKECREHGVLECLDPHTTICVIGTVAVDTFI
jgi:hypothetical protein